MAPILEILDCLVRFVPEATTEVTDFPSGAVNIDIRCHGRYIVVQYVPSEGYGVSELDGGHAGMAGHDAVFTDANEVVAHLRLLFGR